jgi:two-component system sensor histidine kinase DesK
MSDPTPQPQRDPAWVNLHAERLIWLVSILWLPEFIPPVANLFQQRFPAPRFAATFACFLVFLGVHLWAIWQDQRDVEVLQSDARPARVVWWPIGVLTVLSVALTLLGGPAWGSVFIQTSSAAGRRLPISRALRFMVGLILIVAVLVRLQGGTLPDLLNGAFYILLVGITVACVISAIVTNRALRAARHELARLAVTEERLRIARDLHDLLGHSLSLIALKSELAGRLIERAPQRAAGEVRDIESTARDALREVREAVAGYRQPTLADELAGAREILTAAGIRFQLDSPEGAARGLPAAAEAVLSWAVREGVTNVIRHSRARACRVTLARDAGEIRLTVADDGAGPTIASQLSPRTGGSGLPGLADRVRAVGGSVESGPRPEGGFRVAVALPLARADVATEPASQAPPASASAAPAAPAVRLAGNLQEESLS